jgi:alpha-galactosidase/6-phospho-beta-glucosidase family protein
MPGPRITFVGGGSYTWAPQFIRDIAITPELEGSTIVLHDIAPAPLELVTLLGQTIIEARGGAVTLAKTLDLDEALDGADFVLLTITTGGLEAMRYDLEIPERYSIYHSVGDTVGPGGLARALRNIPVVVQIARRMEARCSDAWLLNYTNPMTTLCRAVTRETRVKTIGLCHEWLGVRRHLATLFGVRDAEVQATPGGINHFTWITDLRIRGQDAFPRFREMAARILAGDLLVDADETRSYADHFKVKSRLFQVYGALPAAGDRHVAEFFPYFLSDGAKRGAAYGIWRTSVNERYEWQAQARAIIEGLLSGKIDLRPHLRQDSGEAANKIIRALLGGEPYSGPMNLPNRDQISDLPTDAVVETFGVVNASGVSPMPFGRLPRGVAPVVRRHVDNQEMTVDAALTGNRDLALQILANDPMLCDLASAETMLEEMLEANRRYLPRFFET